MLKSQILIKMKLEKELFYYFVFGVLTTVVNIAVYLFFARLCGVNYLISNVIAWVLSVLFAFFTNKFWVFESRNVNIVKEISLFFAGRLFSGFIDFALMFLFIGVFLFDDFASKIVIQIVVVVLNYVFSKFIVFK